MTGSRIANDASDRGWRWHWRRGFVESVECPLGEWTEYGRAICAAHPIEEVVLTDREPLDFGVGEDPEHRYAFRNETASIKSSRQNSHVIPHDIFRRLGGNNFWADFETPQAATAALSRAAILFARS